MFRLRFTYLNSSFLVYYVFLVLRERTEGSRCNVSLSFKCSSLNPSFSLASHGLIISFWFNNSYPSVAFFPEECMFPFYPFKPFLFQIRRVWYLQWRANTCPLLLYKTVFQYRKFKNKQINKIPKRSLSYISLDLHLKSFLYSLFF